MEDLVFYLDEFVDELRDQLMDPKEKKDKRWQKRPHMAGKGLPFRKGARWGKLGIQMGKEALIMWIDENISDEEKDKRHKPCEGC